MTFTATVSSTLATGTVSFYDNNVLLGTSSPLSGGVGTYLTTLLSPGTHSITATYTTDGNVNSSTSFPLSQIVGAAGVTTTALTSTPNPSIQGQIVSFTATVSNPLAGGSISFMDGSNLLANVNVDSGSAHFGDFNILAGKHAMTAVYSGDLSNLPSTSPVYYQIVNPSVTTLSSSAPSVVFGHSLTLTATVTGQSPTGKVSFYDGSAILETAAIVNGTATLSTAALASGTRSLTAYYIGDGANAPSGSAPVTQNVTPVAESSMTAFWQAPARPNPISLILGDFSGDGIADLAFIHNGLGEISVLIGDGAGSFTGPNASTITYDEAPLLIASGDFNGDGLMDLAVVTYHGLYTVLSTGGGNFALPSASVTTTLTVSSITTGDFNGDGNDDVILTDAVHGTVQVFLGDGTGLFTSGWSYSNNNMSPVAVAAADFNGDGIADIAVLSNASINDISTNSVNIMLGVGDGTFGAPLSFDVGNDPTSIVAAHFVGQGQTDLVVVNQDDNTISLLAGIGTGSFLPQVTYAAPNSPQTVVAADFNADGYPDIALANADSGSEHALISVLLNDQAGHFGTPIGYGAGISTAIAVGDFNGDGKADLATVARPGGPVLVVVLLGTAATTTTIASTPNPSTYGQSVTFTGSVSPASVTGSVTLMDGLNVLATGPVSAGTYSIASNTLSVSTHSITAVYGGDSGDVSSTSTALSQVVYGASSTTTALSSSANPSSYTQSVTITAIVSPPLAIGTVSFYDNLTLLGASGITGGIATFTTSALGIGTHSITANYSGDENFGPSVAPAFSQIVNATAPTTTTLLSSRNPSELGHVVVLTASVSPNSATGSIAFMDGANLLSTVNLANGTAALSTSTLALNTHSLTAVYSGDLADGTSVSPILVQTVSPGTSITLTAPSASSPYGQPVTLTATVGTPGAQGKVTFYDGTTMLGTKTMVDQSASLPALLASGTRSLTALYEGSQGTNAPGSSAVLTHAVTALPEAGFDATLMAYRTGNTPWALATADLNGDGHPDLIVTNKDDLTVSVFIANTNGTFQVGVPYSVGNNPLSVAVADFNGDGFADLVVVNQTDNNVSVLLGDGTGAFAGQVTYSTGAGGSPSSVAAGDFNRDGVPDLAVTNQDTGTVAVMLGVGDGTFLPPVPYSVGTQPVSVAVGDFNNDGYADLVVVTSKTTMQACC